MDKSKYQEDLREIKTIMSRTSQFISLSGLSGVSTGLIALIGVFTAYLLVFKDEMFFTHHPTVQSNAVLLQLLLIASGTLVLSIISAIFFTNRKTRKNEPKVWDIQTKRLLINLSIPLVTGGILCLMLLFKGVIGVLPAITLIFYGMALVNGSKYTLPEIQHLGIIQIILGLLAFQFISYSLMFWAFGFGIVQIIYGLIIQKKY